MRAEPRTASLFRRITRRVGCSASRLRPLQPQPCRESILLNTMPKSGSVYVLKSLAKILRLRAMYIGNQYGLIDQIDVKDALTFSGGGFVSQNHLAPSAENLQILQHFKLKMVLHLRDPRQALLSWIHYPLPKLARTMDETHFRKADPMEWRRTFTPSQATWATSLISESLSKRFGWD
jgi:hypothetical protein